MSENLSIHPRNWPDGDGIKRDTSAPHKGGGKLAKKQAKLTKRRNEREMILRSASKSLHPGAYKVPGSMNQHK